MKTRHENKGLRKLCEHPRRGWAKCDHSWHFNYKPSDPVRRNPKSKDGGYRFSLDRTLHRHVADKSEAEREAFKLRDAIDAGTFGQAAPVQESLTLAQLLEVYLTRAVTPLRPKAVRSLRSQIGLIGRTEIERPDSRTQPFGEWRVVDITTEVIEQFQRRRSTAGIVAANRDLGILRACFNWACSKKRKLAAENPFRDGEKAAVRFAEEHARTRRLQEGEEAKLLAACAPHLRAVAECALETGMRRGEILSLQWKQIEGMHADGTSVEWAPKATLFLPHQKTKTNRDRRVPISSRLKSILEMRRLDPNGQPHALDAFVFGTAIGSQILSMGRAWHRAILSAYGYAVTYAAGANLSPASRQALRSVNLHFHDLRREAGSRWMRACRLRPFSAGWGMRTSASPRRIWPAPRRPNTRRCAASRHIRPACKGSQRGAERAGKKGRRRLRAGTNGAMKMRSAAVRPSCRRAYEPGGRRFESCWARHFFEENLRFGRSPDRFATVRLTND